MAIWREYFANAYISCVHYLVNEKLHWSERIFWLVTITICTGGSYYVISTIFDEYINQKSSLEVDTNYLYFETSFPSVTICEKYRSVDDDPKMRDKSKKLTEELQQEDLVLHALDMAFYRPGKFGGQTVTCTNTPERCLAGNFTYYMNKVRSGCRDLLSYCDFNGVTFECCDEFLPVHTMYGICYAFNNLGGRQISDRKATMKWIIPSLNKVNLTIESFSKYISLSILGSNAVPTTKNTGIDVGESGATNFITNSEHDVFLKVTDTITLNEIVAKDCLFPYENNLKRFNFYSQSNCEIECYINAQLKFCDCAAHTFPKINASEECKLKGLLCSNDNKQIDRYMIHDCLCLPDCNSTDIFEVGYIETKLERPRWLSKSKKSNIRFHIIVPAPLLRYLRYDVTSKLELIVKIGGAIGFFLGCSFLSIVQLFYYLFVRSFVDHIRLLRANKKRKKNAKLNENFLMAKKKLKLHEVEARIWERLQQKESSQE